MMGQRLADAAKAGGAPRAKIPWRNYTADPRWRGSAESFWRFLTHELCHSDDPTIVREGYVKISFADGRPAIVFIVYADTEADAVKTADHDTEFTVGGCLGPRVMWHLRCLI
jgi:hypothetical protein